MLLGQPTGCDSEKAPVRCHWLGLLSFPQGGSWQQCAAGLLSHLEVVSVKRLLDRPPPIHAAEQICMFSNRSWRDEITEGDAERFWIWQSGENKRPYASFTTGKGLKSLTKEREGKLLESPDLEKTIATTSSMSIRILRRSYRHF